MSHRRATAATRRRHRRGKGRAWKLALPLALALLLAHLQAQAAVSAPAPTPGPPSTGQTFTPSPQAAIATGASVSKAGQETNPLETLAKALGIPAAVLALVGGVWFFFTRGKAIQENTKAWKELLRRKNKPAEPPPGSSPHTPHNLPDRTTSAERFVGRAADLQRLEELLAPEGSKAYLTGMGGVGKSELALQYAYDALEHYRGGIVRLDARQGLMAMASEVESFVRSRFPAVSLPEDTSSMDLLPLCWSQWPAGANPPEPVLLILDDQRGDAEGYAAERQLLTGLPPRFRRLLTQREPAPTGAKAIDLPLLQREASLRLLALQAGEGGSERLKAEPQVADDLCEEVGDLPLALVLLGARLAEQQDLRLKNLLDDLRDKGAEANALREAHPELNAREGVVKALLISWQPLSPGAKSLGLLLAVMAPAVIPWELVEACRLPEQELEEGSVFGKQQSELRRARLLDRLGEGMYRLHPLVRQFIRLQGRGQRELVARWRGQLAAVVAQVCRERIPQTHTRAQVEALEPVLPHIRQVAEHGAGDLSAEDLLWPSTGLARVAEHQGDFEEARRWYEQGRAECEERLGPEHPGTATAINNLAALLQATNRLSEAEPLMRRALAIDEASYGPEHPNVATSLNNLAQLLQATNRLSEAEPLMRRALAISEASYGPEHPNVASTLNNLAALLLTTNRFSEAEPLMRRSLAIDEASYGPEHPNVARDLNNLAALLQATNRLEEAEPLSRRHLLIFLALVRQGFQHPHLQAAVENYAALLQAMGLSREDIQTRIKGMIAEATGVNI